VHAMESMAAHTIDCDSVALSWLGGSTLDGGESPTTRQAVADRAIEMLRLGEYWGFAEWVAWGWAARTRVTMFFGHGSMDLFEVFTPMHVSADTVSWGSHLYVIGCLVSHRGTHVAAHWGAINHFVYCWKDVHAEPRICKSNSFVRDATTYASADIASRDIVDYYQRKGYVVIFTAADGNCGPDTVAIHSGRPSTLLSWKQIRREVHDSMLSLRATSWFCDTFQACQEYEADSYRAPASAPIVVPLCDGTPPPPPPAPGVAIAPTSPPPTSYATRPGGKAPAPLEGASPGDETPAPLEESHVKLVHCPGGETPEPHAEVEEIPDLWGSDDEAEYEATHGRHYSAPLKEMVHERKQSLKGRARVKKTKILPMRRNLGERSLSDRVHLGEKLIEFEKGNVVRWLGMVHGG
jgi:hypothetical protein